MVSFPGTSKVSVPKRLANFNSKKILKCEIKRLIIAFQDKAIQTSYKRANIKKNITRQHVPRVSRYIKLLGI